MYTDTTFEKSQQTAKDLFIEEKEKTSILRLCLFFDEQAVLSCAERGKKIVVIL